MNTLKVLFVSFMSHSGSKDATGDHIFLGMLLEVQLARGARSLSFGGVVHARARALGYANQGTNMGVRRCKKTYR